MRLKDPDKLVSFDDCEKLNKKIDGAMTVMSRPIKFGGRPFLYSFAATKEHELALKVKDFTLYTAATDGEKYYWNPNFLQRLQIRQVPVVLEHETIHLVSRHWEIPSGFRLDVWQIAIDFCTNSRMNNDWEKISKEIPDKAGKFFNITDGSFGEVVSLNRLINILKGEEVAPKRLVYSDPKAVMMMPEEVYQEIIDFFPPRPKDNPFSRDSDELDDEEAGDGLGQELPDMGDEGDQFVPSINTLDDHIDQEMEMEVLMEEIFMAMEQAEALNPGSTPSYIKEALAELIEPTADLSEYIRMKSIQISTDGMRNQWKRPRKRSWAIGQYLPRRISNSARWVCLLDTSSSMSIQAISYGLSQLRSLGGETEGVVVPVDAEVHWEAATAIEDMEDLQKVSVVGRGGTVFDDFFYEYTNELGDDFDLVIVITDGMCGKIPAELEPDCDCIWALTQKYQFQPPFGDVVEIWRNLPSSS